MTNDTREITLTWNERRFIERTIQEHAYSVPGKSLPHFGDLVNSILEKLSEKGGGNETATN